MIFIDSYQRQVKEVFIELTIETIQSYVKSPSMLVETVGNGDEMLINASPSKQENMWILNGKVYQGNALMYGKVTENGDSGCTWEIGDFQELITFL